MAAIDRLALVALALVACRDDKPRVAASPPVPRDAPAHVYGEADVASAKYHDLDAIVADKAHARGQLAVVRVSRAAIRENDITAYACTHSSHWLFLSIPPTGRDLVRAIPTSSTGECPRVLMRVNVVEPSSFGGHRADDGTWKDDTSSSQIVEAETLAILDVAPKQRAPAPPNAQFATYDDLRLAPLKGGETAELLLRTVVGDGSVLEGTFTAACDHDGAVYFPSEGHNSALALMQGCRAVRFTARPPSSPDWGDSVDADLLSIGAAAGSAR